MLKWLIAAVVLYGGFVGLLYVAQRSLQYFPERRRTAPSAVGLPEAEEAVLDTADGERVIVWHVPPREGQPIFLYFHGNGGSLRWRVERFRALIADGSGLIALSYRGYGGSSGRPTERGLVEDAAAAYAFAIDRDVRLTLSSSGFRIDPSGSFTKEEGMALPTKEVWTVSPTGLGPYRALLLKIEDPAPPLRPTWDTHHPTFQTATINGTKIAPDANGFYVLPVSVTNAWGLTELQATVVSGAMGFIAFLIGWPTIIELIRKWFRLGPQDMS